MGKHLLVITSFILALINTTYAADTVPPASGLNVDGWCHEVLTSDNVDATLSAITETGDLRDLVSANPEENMLVKYPLLGLNSEQRLLALVLQGGVKEDIMIPESNEPVDDYLLFSQPSELNGYTALADQEVPTQELVDSLKNSVFLNTRDVPVFIGPAATGKSLFLSVFRKAYRYASINMQQFQYWSYDWVNLRSDAIDGSPIPEFKTLIQEKIPAAVNDSPLALLPEAVQQRALSLAKDEIDKFKVGSGAPMSEPVWFNKPLKELILKHYRKKLARELTEDEIVKIMDHHTKLRRVVVGEGNAMPQLDAPPKDVRSTDLLGAKDPQRAATLGNDNPTIWNAGTIPNGHGFAVFWDELFRWPRDIQDASLGIAQDRVLRFGQLPNSALDMFIMGASNVESLEKLEASPASRAFLSRVKRIRMPWKTTPHSVAKVILEMVGHGNYTAREIGNPESEKEAVSRYVLYPRQLKGEKPVGTDGKWEMWFGEGDYEVHGSPYVTLFMGAVGAITRQNLDPEVASQYSSHPIIKSPVYRDPVSRTRFLMGEDLGLGPAAPKALRTLGEYTNDGDFGLDQRDVKKWFDAVKSRAEKNPGKAMSIVDAMHIFFDMMRTKKLNTNANHETRIKWALYAEAIYEHIFVPMIQEDVFQSMTPDDQVGRLYKKTWEILRTLTEEEGATMYYDSERRREVSIEQERGFLEEVRKAYIEANKDAAMDEKAITQILRYNDVDAAMEDPSLRHPGLVRAIKRMLLTKVFEDPTSVIASLADAINNSGDLSSEIQNSVSTYMEGMRSRGWSEAGAREAIDIAAGRLVVVNPVDIKEEEKPDQQQ